MLPYASKIPRGLPRGDSTCIASAFRIKNLFYTPAPEFLYRVVVGHIEMYGRYGYEAVLYGLKIGLLAAFPPDHIAAYPVVLLAPRVDLLDHHIAEEAFAEGRYPVSLYAPARGHRRHIDLKARVLG